MDAEKTVHTSLDGVRVLVIDDEPALVELLEEVLEDEGCLVTSETDSRVIAKLIKNRLDQFDILITDQTMPGLSGIDLVRIVKDVDSDFPIILYSGYSAHMNQEISAQLGIYRYFTKPVNFGDIVRAVRESIGTASKVIGP